MLQNKDNFLSNEILINNVLCNYSIGLSKIECIKFKNSDKHRAVYKITDILNSYCLKKVYFNKAELLFVYSVVEWLSRFGFNTPKFIPTKNHSRFSEYDGNLFVLFPWIDGLKLDYDNINHVIKSAANLSLLHQYSKNFYPINKIKARYGCDNIYISTNKHFYELLSFNNSAFKSRDTFSNVFIEFFLTNIKLSDMCTEIASSINHENLSISICHLDYVNKNILLDKNDDLWTIDFDKCKMDYCAHDISYYLRRILKRDKSLWNLQLLKSILHHYENFKALNLDEYKYIFSYLCFPQKYWKISRDYFKSSKKNHCTEFVSLLNKASINSEAQLNFANDFIELIENKFKVKLKKNFRF